MNQRIKSIRSADGSVENIRHLFASECTISNAKRPETDRRQCKSEPDTGYSVNYDDLCGPWSFPENSFHARQDVSITPRLCVWKLITPEVIANLKRSLDDETAIKHLIGQELEDKASYLNNNCREIFLELAWSIFRFARDNRFTEEGTSALLGIFHLTFTFFLSNPWRTTEETYEFFYKTALLHSVEDPPKSCEIFTFKECRRSVEFFLEILVKHLPLVRFVCLPNCSLILKLARQN